MPKSIEWVGVDWGTSNVRVWGLDANNEIVATSQSEQGMSRLQPDQYSAVLTNLLSGFALAADSPTDVVICGMAGAKQGWVEAPYLQAPADVELLGRQAVSPVADTSQLRIRIISGVCQNVVGQEDVMRGEETQILGLLSQSPDFTGTICMPGTHSKWVEVKNCKIEKFATAMTGELFELLRVHSVLRHSMPDDLIGENTEDGITAGLASGTGSPQLLTSNLFKVRAAALLSGRPDDWCAGYLSGLLVGAEVAAHKPASQTSPVQIIGSDRLNQLYARALDDLGISTQTVDATTATLAGLTAARKQMNID